MNKLVIDTRDNKNVVAHLFVDKVKYISTSESETKRPESILLLVEKVCREAKISIHDIDEINVEEGPGSYTGLKVGVSVANALSFSLQKKVNGRPLGELVEPRYE